MTDAEPDTHAAASDASTPAEHSTDHAETSFVAPRPRVSDAPDAHPDAARLLAQWQERWPEPHPRYFGWGMPGIRFHTLPWSSQEARQARDRRSARRRHRSIVTTLEALSGVRGTMIVELWRGYTGDGDTSLPGLLPWASFTETGVESQEEAEEYTTEFRIRSGRPSLDDLCDVAHREEGRYLLVAEDMTWTVYCYDGGIDVSMLDAEIEQALADAHERWLPPESWVVGHDWMRTATRGDLRRKAKTDRRLEILNARWRKRMARAEELGDDVDMDDDPEG
ncbi:hypothetical protein [Clavibacter sp. VKM Ac-2542]|uniref:DUF3885 domain-containing protein n=1 Tax=Clavibacter sp. VKM Ac-2542 TaxID=2783811 RepID=UPI001F2EEBFF|nr:hypothetical protein [Clavibacter sp. VKM Ac-2542]